jgi:hypothetical protein
LLRYARNDTLLCHCEEQSDEAIFAYQNFCGKLLEQELAFWQERSRILRQRQVAGRQGTTNEEPQTP